MTRTAAWLTGIGLALTGATANADILHNALRDITIFPPTYSGTFAPFDLIENGIGGTNVFGFSTDLQTSDDFSISQAHTIDRVSIDLFSIDDGNPIPPSVMVEFFINQDGQPSDVAYQSIVVDSISLSYESFSNFGAFGNGSSPGTRLTVELADHDIELAAGEWWMSVIPISDETTFGTFRIPEQATGAPVHFRHGGEAHGTGDIGGVAYGSSEWMPFGGPDGARPSRALLGDVAMRIEGTAVPAPSALALLGLGALGAARRRR